MVLPEEGLIPALRTGALSPYPFLNAFLKSCACLPQFREPTFSWDLEVLPAALK